MRFKFSLSVLLFLSTISATFTGCSYFFERKTEATVVRLDRGGAGLSGCLGEGKQVFDDYFSKMDIAEDIDHNVNELTGCYREAIGMFQKHTKTGKSGDLYDAEAISGLLDRVYPDSQFDLGFIENILVVKSFLLGGSSKGITRSDMKRIDKFIEIIGEGFVSTRPYRAILLQKTSLSRDKQGIKEFERAFSVLNRSVGRVLSFLRRKTKTRLDLETTSEFFAKQYFGESAASEKAVYIDLLLSFKQLLLNDDDFELKFSDLDFFVQQSLMSYKSIAEFHLFLQDEVLFTSIGALTTFIAQVPALLNNGEVLKGQAYPSFVRILDRVVETMSYSVRRGENQLLPMVRVNNLLYRMEEAGLVSQKLSARVLAQFITNLVDKWFVDPADPGAYLSETKISFFKGRLGQWSRRHSFINDVMKERESITVDDLIRFYIEKQYSGHKLPKEPAVALEALLASGKDLAMIEWLKALGLVNLKKWSQQHRLMYSNFEPQLSYSDLIVANSIFTEIELFLRRYQEGRNPRVLSYSVTREQTQELYMALRSLGLELKIMDARSFTTGYRSFFEANVFSTQGSNDDVMSLTETFELISVLYASGEISKQIHSEISQSCKKGFSDVLDKEVVEPDCFRKFFRESYVSYFNQLEGVADYWKMMSEKERGEFMVFLEKASREGQISQREFSMGDIRIMVTMSYYLQSIFYNFDKDGNGYVEGDDIVAFEEHFRPFTTDFILKANPWMSEWLERQTIHGTVAPIAFSYILANKKIPDGLSRKVGFVWHSVTRWAWSARVNYTDMTSVLAVLSDSTRKNQVKAIDNFLQSDKEQLIYDLELFEESPDCLVTGVSRFCQFAALSGCSHDVYQDFFIWLKTNSSELFSIEEKNTLGRDELNHRSLLMEVSDRINSNQVLSTQCKFPAVTESADIVTQVKGIKKFFGF